MRPRVPRILRVAWPATAAVVLLLVLAGSLVRAGAACYVVTSPSMGPAAPVGALVVTAPAGDRGIATGEVIAFRPPTERSTVYVHRAVRVDGARIGTRGDANAGADPWTLGRGDVVGRAVAVLPGIGFLVRATPIVLLGVVLVALGTALLRHSAVRWAARLVGFSIVVTAALVTVRPFVGLTVIAAAALPDGGITAKVVSTGLLPVLVSGGDREVVLGAGDSAQLLFSHSSGSVALHAVLALEPWQWGTVVAACLLPTVCSMLFAARARRAHVATA